MPEKNYGLMTCTYIRIRRIIEERGIMGSEYQHIRHEFAPVCDKNSRILVLGTLPSVKSRENRFYYGHPQNRFWKVLALVCHEALPVTIEEKTSFLLRNGIAVWDVIEECDIIASSDSSIRNVVPADIPRLLRESPIERICANGGTAHRLYMKYIYPDTKREIVGLPSTSPANAAFSVERLVEIWGREFAGLP